MTEPVPGLRMYVHGRLRGITRSRLEGRVRGAGLELVRKASDATTIAIAHGTAASLGTDMVLVLPRGAATNVDVLSEISLKKRLGMISPAPGAARTLTGDELARAAKVPVSYVRCLAAYDVLDPACGRFGFADLLAAREVARLMSEGFSPARIIDAVLRLAEAGQHLSTTRLAAAPWSQDEIVQEFHGRLATLLGQLALPFSEAQPSVDAVFARAEERETAGDLANAERWYRVAGKMDRSDPVIPFNLGNVLDAQGRPGEAILAYNEAIARDPTFPDAWFNLGLLAERKQDRALACRHYEGALRADPAYGAALFALGKLLADTDRFAEAQAIWERYLALDPPSPRRRLATRYVALCRLGLASRSCA